MRNSKLAKDKVVWVIVFFAIFWATWEIVSHRAPPAYVVLSAVAMIISSVGLLYRKKWAPKAFMIIAVYYIFNSVYAVTVIPFLEWNESTKEILPIVLIIRGLMLTTFTASVFYIQKHRKRLEGYE